MKIAITGAGGQIAYALIPLLLEAFDDFEIHLSLIDMKERVGLLRGVEMEIEDLDYGHVRSIESGHDVKQLFEGADIGIFLGAAPRGPGMERADLIGLNAPTFYQQGKMIGEVVEKNFKGIVIGNPANTNTLMMIHGSDRKLQSQLHSLMRLDQNRAKAAMRLSNLKIEEGGPFIFGNHSPTGFVMGGTKELNEFVAKRGSEVIKARGLSSAKSAAKAVVDHLKDWLSKEEKIFSTGCYSKNNPYGVDEDLVFSFPFSNKKGIIKMELSKEDEERLKMTEKELIEEREAAWRIFSLS